MEWLDGWKTYIAGVGLMLTGAGMMAAAATKEGGFNFNDMSDGIKMFLAGLATVGIGHKLEKMA